MIDRNPQFDSLADISEEFDPQVIQLAEEFGNRLKNGEEVSVNDYLTRFPNFEEQIKHVFPAVVAMEQFAVALSNEEQFAERSIVASQWVEPPVYRTIGDYEIVRVVGQGGMGVVYLAEQTRLRRMVALKVLPHELASNPKLIRRFQSEARAAASLNHHGIVPVFDIDQGPAVTREGNQTTLYYFTMRYIDGVGLDDVVKLSQQKSAEAAGDSPETATRSVSEGTNSRQMTYLADASSCDSFDRLNCRAHAQTSGAAGEITQVDRKLDVLPAIRNLDCQLDLSLSNQNRWQEIAGIGVQTADALAHAHGNEILHRDIKPSNLLIDSNKKIWVTDFGLAKVVNQEVTATHGVVGTLRFMPPERFSGWSDPRSDVYSVGMTLYELATLKPAFHAADRTELVAKIVGGKIVRPVETVPAIPADLETVVLKAIKTEPAERYQSAEALRDDLQRFLDGLPVLARRANRWERLKSWTKRNPLLAALLAAIGILMPAVSIGSMVAAFQFNEIATELVKETDNANRSLLLAWESEARARTTSRRPEYRIEAMKAIKRAVELLPKVEHNNSDILRLRNEAIAALALTDIELEREFPVGNSFHFWHPSPDFTVYAGSDLNARFECCDAQTGESKWSFQFKPRGKAAPVVPIFSQDSQYVFAYSDMVDKCRLFKCDTGELLLEINTATLGATDGAAFSPDGRLMAVAGSADPIRIYDLRDLSREPQLIEVPFKVTSIFFRDDDSTLCGSGWHEERLFTYDLIDKKAKIVDLQFESNRWTPIKDRLLLGNHKGETRLVEWPTTDRTIYQLPAASQRAIAFLEASESASLLFSQAYSRTYQLIDLETGNQVLEAWGRYPKFNSDGSQFAVTADGKIRFYKIHSSRHFVKTGLSHHHKEFEFHSLRFNNSGDYLVSCSGQEIQIWDATTLRRIADKHSSVQNGSAAFTADGRIVGATHFKVALFEMEQNGDSIEIGDPKHLADVGRGIRSVSAAKKSNRIAWRTPTYSIKVSRLDNLDDAIEIQPRRTSWIPFFELHPDGQMLAVADGTIRLFDTHTGDLIHDFGEESAGHVRTYFQFSPDGRRMICSNLFEQMLFDLENKQLIKRFKTDCNLGGADWSPDGSTLALVLDQETIVLRDAKSFEELARLRIPRPMGIKTIRFSPDGNSIIAQVNENQIFRWDLPAIRKQLRDLQLDWNRLEM